MTKGIYDVIEAESAGSGRNQRANPRYRRLIVPRSAVESFPGRLRHNLLDKG